jgi:hypothetical protein
VNKGDLRPIIDTTVSMLLWAGRWRTAATILRNHNQFTEVSRAVWVYSRYHALSVVVTLTPLVVFMLVPAAIRRHNPPMQRTGAAGIVSLVRKLLERGDHLENI